MNSLKVVVIEETKKYEDRIDDLWVTLLSKYKENSNKEWLYEMNETLLNGYKVYINNQELLRKVINLHGILLKQIDKVETIKYSLDKMFSLGHPEYSNSMVNIGAPLVETNEMIKQQIALSIGYVASTHFEIVLDKVHQIFHSETFGQKPNQGILGFLKNTAYNEPNEINNGMKSTLILTLGEIAKQNQLNNYELIEHKIINIILLYVEKNIPKVRQSGQNAMKNIAQHLEYI